MSMTGKGPVFNELFKNLCLLFASHYSIRNFENGSKFNRLVIY